MAKENSNSKSATGPARNTDGGTDEEEGHACWICATSATRRNELLRGCACRGSHAGYAHLPCLIEAAKHDENTWTGCPTCLQDWTGKQQLGLAHSRWELVRDDPPEDRTRLFAADILATALQEVSGEHELALLLCEEVLEVSRRIDGNSHPDTLMSIGNLAAAHSMMGNDALAQPLYEEALERQRETLGDDAEDTIRHVVVALPFSHHLPRDLGANNNNRRVGPSVER